MRKLRTWTAIGLMAAVLPGAVLAQSTLALVQEPQPNAPYRQPAAVLARLADVPIALDAPGLAPGRTAFTSQDEMLAHLAAIKARAPGVFLGSLGRTPQGRDIPWLIFTAEGLQDPAAVARLNRPVVWLIGQQHGNEPAGGEAMLALASALADGELNPLLDRVTVVVAPRANPDGAAAFQRRNGLDYDLNRDHLLAAQPETQAIQRGMVILAPDAVVDAHEYGATGPLRRFDRLAAADQTILDATHPGVPARSTALARAVYLPAMEARLAAAGLSSAVYLSGMPQTGPIPTGGTAPGISRNYYGLTGAVSFLLESRSAGERDAFQRRVASHYLAAAAVVETAAREGRALRRATAQARRDLARTRGPIPIAYEPTLLPGRLDLMDRETGEPSRETVELRDSRQLQVTETRIRPRGYLLAPQAQSAVDALRLKGVKLCETAPQTLTAVGFHVTRTQPVTRATREASTLSEALEVRLEAREIAPDAGWLWVPMNQPTAAIIAASLEPDSVGSQVHVGLVPVAEDGFAPIYRVLGRAPRTEGRC